MFESSNGLQMGHICVIGWVTDEPQVHQIIVTHGSCTYVEMSDMSHSLLHMVIDESRNKL